MQVKDNVKISAGFKERERETHKKVLIQGNCCSACCLRTVAYLVPFVRKVSFPQRLFDLDCFTFSLFSLVFNKKI